MDNTKRSGGKPERVKLEDSSFGLVVEFVVAIAIISVVLSLMDHWLGS